jgi:hypothetical protein
MNQDGNICQGELAIPPASQATSARIRLWSDRAVLASLLIGCNLLIFAFIQGGHLQFDMGDFKMYYTAAIALRSGQDIYDPGIYARMQRQVVPSLPSGQVQPLTHPPYELLVILPFSLLPYKAACWCWLASTLFLALLCGRLMGNYALVAGMFPLLCVLWEQQDSMLILLILIGCWFALNSDRDVFAGLILGVALFKFQIIIPLALVLAFWRPRMLKGFAVSGAAVFAVSVAMVRPAGMIAYWHDLAGMTRAASPTAIMYRMDLLRNVGLRGLLYQLLGPSSFLIGVVSVTLGLFILGMAWWFMRGSESPTEAKFSFALMCALLLSFHLLTHDLVLLSLPFALLVGSKARWPLVVLYLVPIFPVLAAFPPAWLALLPVSSLATMMIIYWGNSPAVLCNLPSCSRLVKGVTGQGMGV